MSVLVAGICGLNAARKTTTGIAGQNSGHDEA